MTPEVKANELVNKYLDIDSKYEYLSYLMAKQCALIAVDELINSTSWQYITNGLDYWNEVKQEIEKL